MLLICLSLVQNSHNVEILDILFNLLVPMHIFFRQGVFLAGCLKHSYRNPYFSNSFQWLSTGLIETIHVQVALFVKPSAYNFPCVQHFYSNLFYGISYWSLNCYIFKIKQIYDVQGKPNRMYVLYVFIIAKTIYLKFHKFAFFYHRSL